MSWYRRWRQAGGTYFFTAITYRRRHVFINDESRNILRQAIIQTMAERPFESLAFVLLADHLHCVWQLPDGDADFSTRWRLIKARFTQEYLRQNDKAEQESESRIRHGERTIWQRRFWEHLIRDERDLKRHVDYIHYNPVKHGYIERASSWPYSTFRKFQAMGEYESDWGQAEPLTLQGWNVPADD